MDFFTSTKDSALPKLDEIVNGLEESLESRKKQNKAGLAMSIDLLKLVRKEVPPFEKGISFAIAPMNKIGQIEMREYLAEERLKDDLKDLVERRKVIRKLEIDYDSALQSFEQAKTNYNEAKSNLQYLYDQRTTGKILQDAEDKYNACKEDRIKSLTAAKETAQKLLDQKQKFEIFTINRIKHGFNLYSTEIEKSSLEQAELYSQIAQSFSELRGQIDDLASGNVGSINPSIDIDINEGNSNKSDNTPAKPIKPKVDTFSAVRNPFDDLQIK